MRSPLYTPLLTVALAALVAPSLGAQAAKTANKSADVKTAITRRDAIAAEPTLDAVRKATLRFRDVKVALAEGYLRDPGQRV